MIEIGPNLKDAIGFICLICMWFGCIYIVFKH